MGLSNTLYSPIPLAWMGLLDRKSTRLNSSHLGISYAVFCLKKKNPELNYHQERRYRLLYRSVRRAGKEDQQGKRRTRHGHRIRGGRGGTQSRDGRTDELGSG